MFATLLTRVRQWFHDGRNRGAVVGAAVLVVLVGAGMPWIVSHGSEPATVTATPPTVAPTELTPTSAAPQVRKTRTHRPTRVTPTTSSAPSTHQPQHPGTGPGPTTPTSGTPTPTVTSTPYKKDPGGSTTVATGDGGGLNNGGGDGSGGNDDPYANLPMGPGVTKTAISLGVAYDTNASAYGAAFGIPVSDVDQKKQAQGIIDYLNAHGGVAGRKLAPVWHAVDMAGVLHGSNEVQKTCDAFTQDSTVFAVVGDAQSECLLTHQVVEINEATGQDSQYTNYADYAFSPGAFSDAASMRVTADGLEAGGFFSAMPDNPGCTASQRNVGAISFDSNKDDEQPILENALAAVGEHVDTWGYVANDSSNVQQIVLAFKQACVTHVLTPDYSPLLFANAAASQDYQPLYGVSSWQNPALLADHVNAGQLAGFYGVGWSPLRDVDDAHDPGPLGADAKLCVTIMKAQGLPTTRLDMASAYGLCDEMFVLKAALDHATALTAHGFRTAYEAIGAWDSCVTFRVNLSAGHHAGATGYRLLRYDAASGSFIYVSGTKEIT